MRVKTLKYINNNNIGKNKNKNNNHSEYSWCSYALRSCEYEAFLRRIVYKNLSSTGNILNPSRPDCG